MRVAIGQTLLMIAIIILTTNFAILIIKNNNYVNFAFFKIEQTTKEWKIALNKFGNDHRETKRGVNQNTSLQKTEHKPMEFKTFENLTLNTDIDILRQFLTLNYIKLDSIIKYKTIYKILVLVISQSRNSLRRKWIRKSWGNKSVWKNKKWLLVFVTGQEKDDESRKNLHKEAIKYRDILILDIAENFYQLTNKTIVGLTWISHNVHFEYLLKVHDDTFVNIDNAVQFVENKVKSLDGYYGNLIVNNLVSREGKYAVSKIEHLLEVYDPYCSGSGFLMTNNSVFEIIPHFDLKRALKIEDAYIGEIVMRAGIPASHAEEFYTSNTECDYNDDAIISHPVKDFKCLSFLTNQSSQIINITEYIIKYLVLTFIINIL